MCCKICNTSTCGRRMPYARSDNDSHIWNHLSSHSLLFTFSPSFELNRPYHYYSFICHSDDFIRFVGSYSYMHHLLLTNPRMSFYTIYQRMRYRRSNCVSIIVLYLNLKSRMPLFAHVNHETSKLGVWNSHKKRNMLHCG